MISVRLYSERNNSNFDIKSFAKHLVFELALKGKIKVPKTSPKRTEQRNAMQPRPETEETGKAIALLWNYQDHEHCIAGDIASKPRIWNLPPR